MNDPNLDMRGITRLPQRQDSSLEQLEDLAVVANRLGMYDAYDWLVRHTTAARARIHAGEQECTCGVGGFDHSATCARYQDFRGGEGL